MKIASLLLAWAMLAPCAGQQVFVAGRGSVTVFYSVPERAGMQKPVLSADGTTWVATVDYNLIDPPQTMLVESDGVTYERTCSHERCTEPLTARGTATFEIPVTGRQQYLTLIVI